MKFKIRTESVHTQQINVYFISDFLCLTRKKNKK